MSIWDFSDELRKGYLRGGKNALLSKLRKLIEDAHREDKELRDFGVSEEMAAVIKFFKEYVIQKEQVTPKADTIAGIMGLSRARLSDEDHYKKIDEGRKILSVLRRYFGVGMNLHLMSLSGARIKHVWNRVLIDGGEHFYI